jgi:hypothetical protein
VVKVYLDGVEGVLFNGTVAERGNVGLAELVQRRMFLARLGRLGLFAVVEQEIGDGIGIFGWLEQPLLDAHQ